MIPTKGWKGRGPILRLMCHGDPERCYTYKGRPLPLCARCITFYPLMALGSIISFPLFMLIKAGSLLVTIVFIALVSPLIIDGVTQYLGWRRSNNLLRTLTGAIGGSGCGIAVSFIMVRTIELFVGP